MALTSSKPRTAIVYTSATGHTARLAEMVEAALGAEGIEAELFTAAEFPLHELSRYDILLVGTYTWGSGEIPQQLYGLYKALEKAPPRLVTGVFGTGDRCFANYCGAVDLFRDMLYARSELAATLKVEQMPAPQDAMRCRKLAASVLAKYRSSPVLYCKL